MAAPILLDPSNNLDHLRDAIDQAIASNRTLLLKPGTHLTRPGRLEAQQVKVGVDGLRIGVAPSLSNSPCVVKRPDHAIPSTGRDDNCGLWFIPAQHTPQELQGVIWKNHVSPSGTPFQYTVILRGFIDLSGFAVDCNMQNQGLQNAPKHAAEHSAMFRFSGARFSAPPGPNGETRFVYVGFQNVSLTGMLFVNGGYADDVWITYGKAAGFHPNIERISFNAITSQNRKHPSRSTIGFSGLAHHITIRTNDIYSLHIEVQSSTMPSKDAVFTPSKWKIAALKSEHVAFAAKDQAVTLDASGVDATEGFQAHQVAGVVHKSTLKVGKNRRFFRLNGVVFDRVTWKFTANANGDVGPISLATKNNQPCAAVFKKNVFSVAGNFSSGGLISSGPYSATQPNSSVTASFQQCQYQSEFGSSSYPQTLIAKCNRARSVAVS